MARKLRRSLEGGEHPAAKELVEGWIGQHGLSLQIGRSGIEVEVHGGGTNGDRAEVGRVVFIAGVGRLGASGSSSDRLGTCKHLCSSCATFKCRHTLARASAAA